MNLGRFLFSGGAVGVALAVVGAMAMGKGMVRAREPLLSSDSPWNSPAACVAVLKEREKRRGNKGKALREAKVRIGSWNLKWFPDGRSGKPGPEGGTDVRWMACAIAAMQVKVLAVQEVVQHLRGRQALQDLLDLLDAFGGGQWQAELDDCPDDGRQHVGLLFDASRVKVSKLRSLPSINPGRNGCDRRLRPGFAAYLRFAGGADLHLINVHLDSGKTARDFGNRRKSWERLRGVLDGLVEVEPDADVLVLGDFNTMGCNRCLPEVPAEEEIRGLRRALGPGQVKMRLLDPTHPCTDYYRGKTSLLDHVLVSIGSGEFPDGAVTRVEGLCRELMCARPDRAGLNVLSRLSDHCPLVIELDDEDRD